MATCQREGCQEAQYKTLRFCKPCFRDYVDRENWGIGATAWADANPKAELCRRGGCDNPSNNSKGTCTSCEKERMAQVGPGENLALWNWADANPKKTCARSGCDLPPNEKASGRWCHSCWVEYYSDTCHLMADRPFIGLWAQENPKPQVEACPKKVALYDKDGKLRPYNEVFADTVVGAFDDALREKGRAQETDEEYLVALAQRAAKVKGRAQGEAVARQPFVWSAVERMTAKEVNERIDALNIGPPPGWTVTEEVISEKAAAMGKVVRQIFGGKCDCGADSCRETRGCHAKWCGARR